MFSASSMIGISTAWAHCCGTDCRRGSAYRKFSPAGCAATMRRLSLPKGQSGKEVGNERDRTHVLLSR